MFVATVEPGRNAYDKVRTLVELGFRAFRVNFARAKIKDIFDLLRYCLAHIAEEGLECTIFVDLPGPKIRLGKFLKGSEQLAKDQKYSFDLQQSIPSGHHRASVTESTIHLHAEVGDKLVLGDGNVLLEVIDKSSDVLQCRTIRRGKIYNGCGISIAGCYFENKGLTDLDWKILDKLGDLADFICPSFVDNLIPINQIRGYSNTAPRKGIIAKIESPLGVKNMPEIASQTEGLMLCRGDLGTFYSTQEIEELAFLMSALTRASGKIMVFATDYFKSMVDGDPLNEVDILSLKRALRLRPNYLIINETSYSKAWFKIARTATTIQAKLHD